MFSTANKNFSKQEHHDEHSKSEGLFHSMNKELKYRFEIQWQEFQQRKSFNASTCVCKITHTCHGQL
jgi:hypothetical protein